MSTQNIEFIKKLDNQQIIKQGNTIANIDINKKKYFCTFPFPYMNGRLHLGHAYTITNLDIQANYHRLLGENVLFPFGFHGSGMPIVSCANKLKEEINKTNGVLNEEDIKNLPSNCQIKILYEMQVPIDEMIKFCNPEYWVIYFSEKAIEDLKAFGISADFSRSFYTTKMNYSFDSFIQWQFNHLIEDKHLFKGERNIIFCEEDNQPCADHDRATGEGIKPTEINCSISNINYLNLILTITDDIDPEDDKIYFGFDEKYVSYIVNNKTCISNESSYLNIKKQFNTFFITYIDKNLKSAYRDNKKNYNYGTGIYCSKKYLKNFSFYEPEKEVISRTGHKCVVANISQTFINYSNPKLKENVRKYVEQNIKIIPEESYNQLLNTIDWLGEWPVSRNYGLGTLIPGTNDLIDSLSDSTIYMAYYTILPKITKLPKEFITNELWDYIFLDKKYDIPKYFTTLIQEMKEEFIYWYPLDLRVSGKDLISNHLTMSLFNHYAIWKDIKYLPKQYNINGYLMINGKKMSKSTGNFMTLREVHEKYGSSITRFLLSTNSGIDDGDFRESELSAIAKKLIEERENCINYYNQQHDEIRKENIIDHIFNDHICNTLKNVENYYEKSMTNFIINSFHFLIDKKNQYLKRIEQSNISIDISLMKFYVKILVIIMKPIIPQWSDNIIDKLGLLNQWPSEIEQIKNKMNLYYDDMMNKVIDEIKKKKNFNKIIIHIFKTFNTIELDVINNPDIVLNKTGKELGSYKTSQRYINNLIEKYGNPVVDNIVEQKENKEFSFLTEYLHIFTGLDKNIFEFREYDNNEKIGAVKNNPGNPKIEFV